jgi:hypothetical protein
MDLHKPPPGGYPTYIGVGNSILHLKLTTKQRKRIFGASKRLSESLRKRKEKKYNA